MSDLYPPFTPTPGGTVIGAQIGAYYRWVYIKNSSNYDLLYSLMPDEPTIITNYKQWSGRIEPGHGAIITIPSQRDPISPQWQADKHGAFGGIIWLALLQYSGNLALSGTQSVQNNVWITGYFEWEGYPQIDASVANGSQYQQQRTVIVPIAVQPTVGTFQFLAGFTTYMSSTFGLFPANFANQQVTAYIYGGWIAAEHTNTSFMALDLDVVTLDNSNNLVSFITVAKYEMWANITNNTHDSQPVVSGSANYMGTLALLPGTTATQITLRWHCTSLGGTSPQGLTWTIAWAPDAQNFGSPWPIGRAPTGQYADQGTANGPY